MLDEYFLHIITKFYWCRHAINDFTADRSFPQPVFSIFYIPITSITARHQNLMGRRSMGSEISDVVC